jgi:hypothetical protein
VHGGPTPRVDSIQIAFFSERTAIPKKEEHALTEEGALGKLIHTEKRNAVVREVEAEIIISIEMARRLETWIHEKIEQVETLRGKGSSNGK